MTLLQRYWRPFAGLPSWVTIARLHTAGEIANGEQMVAAGPEPSTGDPYRLVSLVSLATVLAAAGR